MSAHSHSHAAREVSRSTGVASYDRLFAVGIGLNVGIVVCQVVLGVFSSSLALIADAGHNLSDVLALILAWAAIALGRRRSSLNRTYGWRRMSIVAALINAITIFVVTAIVSWEAVQRLVAPSAVEGSTMIFGAAAAAGLNALVALMFRRGGTSDLNVRGAFLHMAADAAVSLGVVAAGIVIILTGWVQLDPIASLAISAVILWSAWGLVRDAGNLLLDAVPLRVNTGEVRIYLLGLPHVTDVHDLHIWAMSTTEIALTAHLVTAQDPPFDALLSRVCRELRDDFGIEHATVQLERGDPNFPCLLAHAHRV